MEASIHFQMKVRTASFKKDSGIGKGFQKIKKNFQNIFIPELVEGVREDLLSLEIKEEEEEKLKLHIFSQTKSSSDIIDHTIKDYKTNEPSPINEIDATLELVEKFFTRYLEKLASETNGILISRTLVTSETLQGLQNHYLDGTVDSAIYWLHDLGDIILASTAVHSARADFRNILYAVKDTMKILEIDLERKRSLRNFLTRLLETSDLDLNKNPHLVFKDLRWHLPSSAPLIPIFYQRLQFYFPEDHPRRENIF